MPPSHDESVRPFAFAGAGVLFEKLECCFVVPTSLGPCLEGDQTQIGILASRPAKLQSLGRHSRPWMADAWAHIMQHDAACPGVAPCRVGGSLDADGF